MLGLVVLGVGLAQVVALTTAWCVWDVATTDVYLLEVEGRSKGRWLLLALIPLVGTAWWIEAGRPPPGMEPLVPRHRHYDTSP